MSKGSISERKYNANEEKHLRGLKIARDHPISLREEEEEEEEEEKEKEKEN